MAAIKQLAGQTIWYGASNIGAKFLNYLLTPLITYLLSNAEGMKDYGDFSLLYVWIAVVNVVFTYGFETGYFRFSNKEGVDRKTLFQTTFGSLVITTPILVILIILFRHPINNFIGLDGHPNYITWCAYLIALDTISAIPFAKLRQENRPKKYAFVKLSGILVNIFLTAFFLMYLPGHVAANPDSVFASWVNQNTAVGFLIMANLIQNLFVFLLLYKEWKGFKFNFDLKLWKKIFNYSSPMIIIGLAGMINEVIDRQMLAKFLPLEPDDAKRIVGIYSANYKLAILITLFISAFKMAAEPFFFNQAKEKNAPQLYARVMKWFVITMCLAFLFTTLYLDVLKYFIGESYRSGMGIVPILLVANICLGIYYNLSVWYKLTDRMSMGLYIAVFGAIVTLLGNYFFIPYWGMYAAAYVTLLCYFLMMITTYLMGQKYYPIPYNIKKLVAYVVVMLLLYGGESILRLITENLVIRLIGATIFMGLFLLLILKAEKKELKGMPLIGKWIDR